MRARTLVCIEVLGFTSALMPWLAGQHPPGASVVVANLESVMQENFDTPEYWRLRRQMRYADELVTTAQRFVSNEMRDVQSEASEDIPNDTFLAVHMRRNDFLFVRSHTIPSPDATVEQIVAALEASSIAARTLFVASDGWGEARDVDFSYIVRTLRDTHGISVFKYPEGKMLTGESVQPYFKTPCLSIAQVQHTAAT
eukprot:m.765903 g.765903  ORF g.765903 m.765903 type:complete len:198 (-) comp23223_c0_seq29:1671-2264(-)